MGPVYPVAARDAEEHSSSYAVIDLNYRLKFLIKAC